MSLDTTRPAARESAADPWPDSEVRRRSRRHRLWVVLGLIVVLYALNLDTRWQMGRDSALYVVMGNNLAAGEGALFNGRVLPWISPALPLLWAGIVRTLGPSYLAGRLVMVALALLLVGASYWLVRRQRRPDAVALGVVAVLGFNGYLFWTTGMLLTDMPFAALLTLTLVLLYHALADRPMVAVAAGLVFGLAMLTRLVGLVLLPLVVVGLVLDGSVCRLPRRRLRVAGLFLAGVVPMLLGWYAWYHQASRQGHQGYFQHAQEMVSENPGRMAATFVRHIPEVPRHVMSLLIDQRPPWLVAAAMCGLLVPGLAVSARRREMLLLLPAGGYVLFLMAYDATSVADRYLLPLLGLLALWLVDGSRLICQWLASRVPRLARLIGPRAGLTVLLTLVVAMSIIPTLYNTLRWKSQPTPIEVRSERERALLPLGEWINTHIPAEGVILARESTVVHFLTGRRTLLLREPGRDQPVEPFRERIREQISQADVLVVDTDLNDFRTRELQAYLADQPDPPVPAVEIGPYSVYRVGDF